MQHTQTVRERQVLLDTAIQECGSIEAVFALALLNGLSITDDLIVGSVLESPGIWNKEVQNYYTINALHPASGDQGLQLPGGIGNWAIQYEFIVS